MLSYRQSTVNEIHLGFKPGLIYSKPSHLLNVYVEVKENEIQFLYLL